MPPRPGAVSRVSSLHPDPAQDEGVPGARGPRQSSAAALRRLQIRHRQSRAAGLRRSARRALDEGSHASLRSDRGRGARRQVAIVKILLVGLGWWGEKHLRVLTELGLEVWVADLAEERRAFAVRAGVAPERAVADFRGALARVDAVDVVTPADSHLALAGECLQAGKHCFVEK